MSEYFAEAKYSGCWVINELDLSNYATKSDLKIATGVDTSIFAKKVDLANLRSNVDKLDIDKFKNVSITLSNLKRKVDKLDADRLLPVPIDLSKLSDEVKTNVVKKDIYNANIKNIEDKIPDITDLATLTGKINEAEKEISSITNLAMTTALDAKINAVKNKIRNITNLATTTAFTTVENKMLRVSKLVKKNWTKLITQQN